MGIDIRWKQKFENFKKAVMQFAEFIEKDKSNNYYDSVIEKCIIAFTGYQGILDHRTNNEDSAGSNLSPGDSKFKFLMKSGFNVF